MNLKSFFLFCLVLLTISANYTFRYPTPAHLGPYNYVPIGGRDYWSYGDRGYAGQFSGYRSNEYWSPWSYGEYPYGSYY